MGDKGEGGVKNLKKMCDIIYGQPLNALKRFLTAVITKRVSNTPDKSRHHP